MWRPTLACWYALSGRVIVQQNRFSLVSAKKHQVLFKNSMLGNAGTMCTETSAEITSIEGNTSALVHKPRPPEHNSVPLLPPRYPSPPPGKMNLISNQGLSDISPTEMYGALKRLSSENLLETFAANYADMDKIHYALVMKRLNEVRIRLSEKRSHEFVENLFQDDRFQVLVAFLTRKGRYYDADVTFNTLRCLIEFGFPEDHPSVHVYLRLISHHINSLHLDQMAELLYTIKHISSYTHTKLIHECIKALAPERTTEFKLLDGFQAMILLDTYPEEMAVHIARLLGLVKKDMQDSDMKLDHEYAYLLLNSLSKIRHLTKYHIQDLLEFAIHTIHKNCHKYENVTSVLNILQIFNDLGFYQMKCFDDFGDLFCDKESLIFQTEVSEKILALHLLSTQSHFHLNLCQTIEQNLDLDLSMSDLLRYISCCWTFRYQFVNKNTLVDIVDSLYQNLWNGDKPIHVDTYLELCLILFTYNMPLPEDLANLDLVQHDNHSIPDCGSPTDDPNIFRSVYMTDDDIQNGIFRGSYTGGWHVHRTEIIDILRPKYQTLPQTVQEIYNKSHRPPSSSDSEMMEFHGYLSAAASDYNIERSCLLKSGLYLDYVLTKKTDEDLHGGEHNNSCKRLGVKLMPASATVRNSAGLKQLPEMYMSAVCSLGYQCLVITSYTWKDIPHDEKIAYLQDKLYETMSQENQEYEINII